MVKICKTHADLQKELTDAGDKLVVIDFFAEWCGPCKVIAPVIQKWSEEQTDVVYLKVDVDENEESSGAYEVEAMPTFIFVKNGKKVDSVVGANQDKLKDKIAALK